MLVVGTGLAGASAAATLAELGYQVEAFTFHDSPRRAHSIAAQGGINAAKNYRGDGDSIYRLFYDTIKGGDFRAREGNVYRLAQVSGNIIDQMRRPGRAVRPRVRRPARQPQLRRRPGQPHVLRRRPDRPAAAARRLPADGPPGRPRQRQAVEPHRARRHRRHRRPLRRHRHPRPAHRRVPLARRPRRRAGHRRLRQRLLPVDQRHGLQRHGGVAGPPARAPVRQPLLHADPPDVHPAVRRLPVEADADVRVAAQRRPGLGAQATPTTTGPPARSPRASATTTSSGCTRASATSRHATSPRAPPSGPSTPAAASGPRRTASTSTSPTPSAGSASTSSRERYGNLFEMYERITGEDPYDVPMRIYPASHYTMGGLWVDYELMTTVPGLYCAGEANFSDHGANRLGASALMQGLADGYFVLPYTIGNYLAPMLNKPIPGHRPPGVRRRRIGGRGALRRLPRHRWHPLAGPLPPRARPDHLGLLRHGAHRGRAWRRRCPRSRRCTTSSRRTCASPGAATSVNQTLEKAGRVDDFFELGMLMCRDALEREESCGGHFRAEYQTEEGEALRDDEQLRPRRGVGVDRRPDQTPTPPGGAGVRDRSLPDPELQVTLDARGARCAAEDASSQPHGQGLAAGRARRRRASSRRTTSTRSARRRRSSSCSTSSTSG